MKRKKPLPLRPRVLNSAERGGADSGPVCSDVTISPRPGHRVQGRIPVCVTGFPEVLKVLEQGLIFKLNHLNVCSFCKEREIVLDQQLANFFCKGPG